MLAKKFNKMCGIVTTYAQRFEFFLLCYVSGTMYINREMKYMLIRLKFLFQKNGNKMICELCL